MPKLLIHKIKINLFFILLINLIFYHNIHSEQASTVYSDAFEQAAGVAKYKETPKNVSLTNFERISCVVLLAGGSYYFDNHNKDEKRLNFIYGFDVISSALFSAIGAKIYKQSIIDSALLGGISGLTIFSSKDMVIHNIDKPGFGIAGKLIHSAGSSMRNNLATGEKPFSRYEVDFGPILFGINSIQKNNKVYFSLLPGPTLTLSANIIRGNSFDADNSFKFGALIFKGDLEKGWGTSDTPSAGITSTNTIIIRNDLENRWKENYKSTLIHENMHSLQYNEIGIIGIPMEKMIEKKFDNKPSWISLNRDFGIMLGYFLGKLEPDHNKRIYEIEPELWEEHYNLK